MPSPRWNELLLSTLGHGHRYDIFTLVTSVSGQRCMTICPSHAAVTVALHVPFSVTVGETIAWLEGLRGSSLRLMETFIFWGWQKIGLGHCASGWLVSAAYNQTMLASRAASRSPQCLISISSSINVRGSGC